jgi:hypothetical protein
MDLGIIKLAAESEGEYFTGTTVHHVRNRYHLRNTKRRIRRMGQRESRFQKDTSHCINTQLVHKAAVSRKASALEDLSGIREGSTVRREPRYERHSRAFVTTSSIHLSIRQHGPVCPSIWWIPGTRAVPV